MHRLSKIATPIQNMDMTEYGEHLRQPGSLKNAARYVFTAYVAAAFICIFGWAALTGVRVDTTSSLVHQEAFVGYRTAGVGR